MPHPPSVSFVSLGCPKNLVDSEKMLGLLAEAGCPIVSADAAEADGVVINTCGFLSAAREEAVEVIRDAVAQKRRGRVRRVVVAGCLVQRDGEELLRLVPGIDALVGVHQREDVVRAVMEPPGPAPRARKARPPVSLFLGDYHPASWTGDNRSDQARLRLTPTHYAYVRMSEGCNQKCTFCTIPSIRGPMHSKPLAEILDEARELIDDGAVELILIGQDTTSYGRDVGYDAGLAGLLRELNRLGGVEWVRLMYAYPADFTDEMIDAIADCDRVVKYVDLPLQHINDRVLKAMHRRVTRRETEALLDRLRRRIPGVHIRTTFIAGFPGETDAECDELRRFIADFGFEAVGVFPYSHEPGTPAARMKHQTPPEIISARVDQLMRAQQEVAFRRAAARQGERLRVLVDGPDDDGGVIARHAGQAPEVDSVVFVQADDLTPGSFADVRCTGSRGYDLLARPAATSLPAVNSSRI